MVFGYNLEFEFLRQNHKKVPSTLRASVMLKNRALMKGKYEKHAN